jgi:methyltransferase family protein
VHVGARSPVVLADNAGSMRGPELTEIGAVVTQDGLLDFLILYESLLERTAPGSLAVHAFVAEDQVADRLAGLALEQVEIDRRPGPPEGCTVVDAHSIVLASAPAQRVPKVLDADQPGITLVKDGRGFKEVETGAVEVLRLAGPGASAGRSAADRVDAVIDRFPRIAPVIPLYATLANRAAARLGMEVIADPAAFARDRLLEAGIPARRTDLPELLNRRGLHGSAVEVGVKRGLFSEVILKVWRGARLIAVDPWTEAPANEYVDVSNVEQAQHDRFFEETKERLAQFGPRSTIWRTTSAEAAARIERHSLDFVYLDARHDYDSVKEDLGHWFDKLRPGGVFAGHDYLDDVRTSGVVGVKSAVDEFFGARGLPVRQTYVDAPLTPGPPPSWVVQIPTG